MSDATEILEHEMTNAAEVLQPVITPCKTFCSL